MDSIEIQKGVRISLEDILSGISQVDLSSLEKFSEEINRLVARRKTKAPSERELELIHNIYQPWESELQKKYDALTEKNLAGTITNSEHSKLLELVVLAEKKNAQWLEAMIELAELRSISLEELQAQLGIIHPPHST